jgi:nucleoside-diphosphate-sugar epimerase
VYASSAGVFGPTDGDTPRPLTHYGAFKLATEGCARAYWQDARIASVGFRPYIVYGPAREEHGSSAGPTLACRAAAWDEPYIIPFTGTTGLVYVDDVAAAFVAALQATTEDAQVFNLPGEAASTEQIIAEIHRHLPEARLSTSGPALPIAAEIPEGQLRTVFPDLPRTTLAAGVRQTIDFYRVHRRQPG